MTNFTDLQIEKFAKAGINAGERAKLVEVPEDIFGNEIEKLPEEIATATNIFNENAYLQYYIVRASKKSSNPGSLIGIVMNKKGSRHFKERVCYLSTDYFKGDYLDFQLNKYYKQAA